MKLLFKRMLVSALSVMLSVALVVSGTCIPVYAQNDDKAEENVVQIEALSGYQASAIEQQAIASGFLPVLSNGGLSLLYKQATAEVALYSADKNEIIY